MTSEWMWVDSKPKRARARDDIQGASLIGVDTEYDSFRYFREKLCLIQVVSGSVTYLFDPLDTLDITFLGNVFSDSDILKIVHAGDNDLRILNRDYGFVFKNIFDTYRAASVLGCRYLSLSNVVCTYLGVALNKSKKMQRSQWDIRPLSDEQIQYAVRDTSYLLDLYRILDATLNREALGAKAHEAFESLEEIRWSEKVLDPEGFAKIKGVEDLDETGLQYLKRLWSWRFEKARQTNRARFMILSDQELIGLARAEITSVLSLAETGILAPRKVEQYGADIVGLLHEPHDAKRGHSTE